MTRLAKTFRMMLSAGALTALLVAPMMVASAVNAGTTRTTIDAPVQAKKGLGLVLLVSLQRA
jgi:hypothetical protein